MSASSPPVTRAAQEKGGMLGSYPTSSLASPSSPSPSSSAQPSVPSSSSSSNSSSNTQYELSTSSKGRRQKSTHRTHSEKEKEKENKGSKPSPSSSYWAHLPVELFVAVLQSCALNELLTVAQVCSHWELMARDSQLWRRLCQTHFGHNANLTEGAFAKLHYSWPHALRDWKDWFLFRRMFKREVAGSVHLDFVAYECDGKTKLTAEKRSGFSPYAQLQLDQWTGEFHCGPQQPVQKGVRDITFHFGEPNTIIDIRVHRRSARFAKKQCIGRAALPLFALRCEEETLWLELSDLAPPEALADTGSSNTSSSNTSSNNSSAITPSSSSSEEDAVPRGSVRIALRVTLRPVRYTVNDFEFVASVSHGSSALGASEMLFVRDRDTKKPYFLKILSRERERDVDGASSDGDSAGTEETAQEELETFTMTVTDSVNHKGEDEGDSREAASLQWRLPSHPFLVDLFTSFRKGATHYLLLEWIEGGELFSTAKRSAEGRFGEEQARFYIAETVLALEHLHLHGVVYRDLRPENLLLDRKGHVKLTRPLRATDAHERYSEFLAPELLQGGESSGSAAQTCKVDWWSLGCILYQMLVGVAPFSHPSVTVTAQRILHAEYALPQGKYALSSAASELMRGLLTRSTKKRFDVRQIKRHAFFAGIDWSKLSRRELKPSVRPFRRWQHTADALTESCSTSESTTSTTLSEMLTASRA